MVSQTLKNQALVTELNEYLKYYKFVSNAPTELTEKEKQSIEKLPPSERETAKSECLKNKETAKQTKLRGMLDQIEEKIVAAGVSVETAEDLHNAIEKAKDNNYKFSYEATQDVKNARTEPETTPQPDIMGTKALNELAGMLGRATLTALLSTLGVITLATRRRQRRNARQNQNQRRRQNTR